MFHCGCGFQFTGPGDIRNCEVVLTTEGWVSICPQCRTAYIPSNNWEIVNLEELEVLLTEEQRKEQLERYISGQLNHM